MPTIDDPTPPHRLHHFAARLNTVLDGLVDAPAWSLSTGEQREVLLDLARAQSRIEALRLRVLAAADRADVAADTAATSTTAWLAHTTRIPVGVAHRDLTLATTLDTDLSDTSDALAAGVIDTDHARVITETITGLPAEVTTLEPGLVARVEKHLLGLAHDHDARTLKRLARHVLDVIDPDQAEEALGRRLAAEEAAAEQTTSFTITDNGDGTHSGRFKISSLHAAMLKKALEALTNPANRATGTSTPGTSGTGTSGTGTSGTAASSTSGTGTGGTGTSTPGTSSTGTSSGAGDPAASEKPRRTPRPELLGQAFTQLLERLDPTRLPTSGGVNATIVITLDYENLLTGLGTAHLDTGETISASLARRLACQAGVIPTVIRRLIDGRSVVLDMGRKRRLYTETQRIALTIEQSGCTTEGCTRPAAWCDTHHDTPWSTGGTTNLDNGRLLCPHHHTKAHSPSYHTTHHPPPPRHHQLHPTHLRHGRFPSTWPRPRGTPTPSHDPEDGPGPAACGRSDGRRSTVDGRRSAVGGRHTKRPTCTPWCGRTYKM